MRAAGMWIFQLSNDDPRVRSRGPASSRSTRFELRSTKSWDDDMNEQNETESGRAVALIIAVQ